MKISCNKSLSKNSGPHIFTRRMLTLMEKLYDIKVVDTSSNPDIHLGLITLNEVPKGCKSVLRVDGLYWNTMDRSGIKMNEDIFRSIKKADGVIFQSEFCKSCYVKKLGNINNSVVIINAVDWDAIDNITPKNLPTPLNIVASAKWRPTKRLGSICRGFIESSVNRQLYIIGKPSEDRIKHKMITYLGDMSPIQSLAVIKSCQHAVHLAKFDPCPNSVVEFISCGLPVLHTAGGGTPEIVGNLGVRIPFDDNWDYTPIKGVDEVPSNIVAEFVQKLVSMDKINRPKYLNLIHAVEQYYKFFKHILRD